MILDERYQIGLLIHLFMQQKINRFTMNEMFATFIVIAVKEISWDMLCCETLSVSIVYIVLINKMWFGQLQLQVHLNVVFHNKTVGWKVMFITVWLQYFQCLKADFFLWLFAKPQMRQRKPPTSSRSWLQVMNAITACIVFITARIMAFLVFQLLRHSSQQLQ